MMDGTVTDYSKEEVQTANQQLKNGNAMEIDVISAELFKSDIETKLKNNVFHKQSEWTKAYCEAFCFLFVTETSIRNIDKTYK